MGEHPHILWVSHMIIAIFFPKSDSQILKHYELWDINKNLIGTSQGARHRRYSLWAMPMP